MELDRRGAVVRPELSAQPDKGRRRAAPAKSFLTIKIPQLPRCARSRCSGRLAYEDRAAPGPWLSNVDSQEVVCD